MRRITIALALAAVVVVGALATMSDERSKAVTESPIRLAGCINGVCS